MAMIAGIPAQGDPIHELAGSPAHMTMVYFGDGALPDEVIEEIAEELGGIISEYVPEEVPTTGRQLLGDDEADVITIAPTALADLRARMLELPAVRREYDKHDQFPTWTPHITVGYPYAPATDADAEPSEIPNSIVIDRIGIWNGSDEAIDDKVFELPRWKDYEDEPPVSMTASAIYTADPNFKPARFMIPVLLPEAIFTGDKRKFAPFGTTVRDLPIPLMWQEKTSTGHMTSVVVGRIDSVERLPGGRGLGKALGVFDRGPYAQEAQRLVAEGFLRGVSPDLDSLEFIDTEDEAYLHYGSARVMAATLVPMPAFQEVSIHLVLEDLPDGEYTESDPLTASLGIASNIPVEPPQEWFDNPRFREPTPLTTSDDGHVFGHIALWKTGHIGLPFSQKPPRSSSHYAYFLTGVVRADTGKDIPVGQLTLTGGHAPLSASAKDAAAHYANTESAIADVRAGEDSFGIWVAGAMRPGTPASRVREFRAAKPSGDWRAIAGRHELVAVCMVNVPGYPVPRANLFQGRVTSIVAAGSYDPQELVTVEDVNRDISGELAAQREEAISKVSALSDFNRMYTPEARQGMAEKGWARSDGSFPIADIIDLRRAMHLCKRVAPAERQGVRQHIVQRAQALGRTDLVPQEWIDALAVHTAVFSSTIDVSVGPRYRAKHMPRGDSGEFRKILYRLNDGLPDDAQVIKAFIRTAISAEEKGNTEVATEAVKQVVKQLEPNVDKYPESDIILNELKRSLSPIE